MIDTISQPWPWYIAGPLISLVMALLIYFGKQFGVSNNLRTGCAILGAGKVTTFFQFDWKAQIWNIIFILGAVIGGFIAANFLTATTVIDLNPNTVSALNEIGIQNAGESYLPEIIFGASALSSVKGIVVLLVGGFLVGFGTRYAGGCTSGHAISGISNLQIPSLIAVIGFFIGGLIMTHFLIPIIF
ncbi:MAG: putative membrane protein YedE/YeeE [Saprospiraceae bacterium]|jgi:uncharacterized membrane protein YedE/YeeE